MSYMEHDELLEVSALNSGLPPEGPGDSIPGSLPEDDPWGEAGLRPEGAESFGEAAGSAGEVTGEQESSGAPEMEEGLPPSSEKTESEEGIPEGEPPAEKPKRKRTTRKKAVGLPPAEQMEDGAASGEIPPSGDGPDGMMEDTQESHAENPAGDDGYDETAAFVLEETGDPEETVQQDVRSETPDAGSGDTAGSGSPPASMPAEETETASPPRVRRVRRTVSSEKAAPKPKEQFASRPLSSRPALLSLDLNKLDQELTEEEREEWNAIYASYRSKSLLTGRIMGIDEHAFTVRNRETRQTERRRMLCAVIISYRAKVLIPETEMWLPGQEKPPHVLRNMSGAEIDYTILDVDREGGVAIASRRMAETARRHFFDTVKGGRKLGERLTCRVLAVGPKRCLVECGGRDLNLSQKDMTYSATPDLRERYHAGQILDCILKEYDRESGQLWISVKETTANPFFGAIKRHPVGSRRQAKISGKYGGGVFCTLPDETVCLCHYSTRHSDSDFHVGDTVILAIKRFDYDRELIYGRILSKW